MFGCLVGVLLLSGGAASEVESVECGRLRLGFDRETGQWRELALTPGGENLLGAPAAPDLEVVADDHPWPAAGEWQIQPPIVEAMPEGWRLQVVRRSREWRVTSTYWVSSASLFIRRQGAVRWEGTEPVKVVGTVLRVPGVTFGGARDARWSLPGNYPGEEKLLSASESGRSTQEQGWTGSDTGMAFVYSGERGLGLLVGYALAADQASVLVEEVEGGVSLVHRFHTLGFLPPGGEIEVGVQVLQMAEGDWEAFRRTAADLAQRLHGGPPQDRPAWLEGAVLQELHPWGRLEAWPQGDRGNRLPSLQAQLPYLQALGITGLWLLPLSNRPPWVYFLPRFRHLDEAVATPEQLRSFLAAAHQLGLRTLLDLVAYGISPESPDVALLPDSVWCRDEHGERQKAWGGSVLAADCSHPDWNAHIVELGSYWIREFGADGFRLDCGGSGQAPNWRSPLGWRANLALVAGGIAQNGQLRQALRRLNPDAVLLPEAAAPCYFRSADLLFDYPFYRVCREITWEPRTDRWVAQARQWLAAQQLTHSPRQQAALVRFLENHDTVAASEFFGVGPSQALTALCAFLPGVLLLYQEEEIGFAPELRTWLRLRQELPELKRGQADFTSVTASDPRVLAFLRFTEDQAAVVAVNFGPAEASCRLDWPELLARRWPVCQDALTGEPVGRGQPVLIPAYRPRVLTLRMASRPSARPPRRSKEERLPRFPLILHRTQDSRPGGITRYTFHLAPMSGWWVRTGEGFLQDEFVDRHRNVREGESLVDAMPPLARCWRPLQSGLWEGPGRASWGFLSPGGRALEFRIRDRSRLQHVRIEDPSATGQQVEVAIEAVGSRRPFQVIEWEEGAARLSSLRREPFVTVQGTVRIDPLWVTISNGFYTAALSRRHGGTLGGLYHRGETRSRLAASEVYTDWGLFERGLHVASEWETNPELEVTPRGERTQITFRGRLRRPSWNGVQAGDVMEPPVAYRLTYEVDSSPVIGVTLGLASTTDRPDTRAFVAYRLPFAGVDRWEVRGLDPPIQGWVGERPGQRTFEAGLPGVELGKVEMRLSSRGRTLRLRAFRGHPAPPQNPFLLDGGDTLHFFLALLNGGAVSLSAHEEWTASFEIVME